MVPPFPPLPGSSGSQLGVGVTPWQYLEAALVVTTGGVGVGNATGNSWWSLGMLLDILQAQEAPTTDSAAPRSCTEQGCLPLWSS